MPYFNPDDYDYGEPADLVVDDEAVPSITSFRLETWPTLDELAPTPAQLAAMLRLAARCWQSGKASLMEWAMDIVQLLDLVDDDDRKVLIKYGIRDQHYSRRPGNDQIEWSITYWDRVLRMEVTWQAATFDDEGRPLLDGDGKIIRQPVPPELSAYNDKLWVNSVVSRDLKPDRMPAAEVERYYDNLKKLNGALERLSVRIYKKISRNTPPLMPMQYRGLDARETSEELPTDEEEPQQDPVPVHPGRRAS